MPVYCFTNDKLNKTVELVYSMDNVPETVKINGVRYYHDIAAEHVSVPSSSGWPMECVASGVNASQAGELRKHFKDNGLNIEVTSDGNPVYKSNAERRKALKSRGLIDKSSYY